MCHLGGGRVAKHNRDTCWPCRADAACCVPVRPGESLRKEAVQPQGGNTLCCGVVVVPTAAGRGSGKYQSFLSGI